MSLPGTTIALTIDRGGAQRVVNIKMGSTAEAAFIKASAPVPGYLGVDITPMTPELRAPIRVHADERGHRPRRGAVSGSPAKNAGSPSADALPAPSAVLTPRPRRAPALQSRRCPEGIA